MQRCCSLKYALLPQQPISIENELSVLTFLLQSLRNRFRRYNRWNEQHDLCRIFAGADNAFVARSRPIGHYITILMHGIRRIIGIVQGYHSYLALNPPLVARRERLAVFFRIDEKQNVLHFYNMISERRTMFLHHQLGG